MNIGNIDEETRIKMEFIDLELLTIGANDGIIMEVEMIMRVKHLKKSGS